MKNIIKLIQNSDFSLETQTNFYNRIATVSHAIDAYNKHYVEGKKLLTEADARLINAIVADDYETKQVTEQAIVQIVNDLRETRAQIKALTVKNKSYYKLLMNHQKKNDDEHVYQLPRQQVFELLKALTDGIKANPNFQGLEIAISTGYLKK